MCISWPVVCSFLMAPKALWAPLSTLQLMITTCYSGLCSGLKNSPVTSLIYYLQTTGSRRHLDRAGRAHSNGWDGIVGMVLNSSKTCMIAFHSLDSSRYEPSSCGLCVCVFHMKGYVRAHVLTHLSVEIWLKSSVNYVANMKSIYKGMVWVHVWILFHLFCNHIPPG